MSKTNVITGNQDHKLAVELDLDTVSNAAFNEAITQFYSWSKSQPPVEPLGMENGWFNVTPEQAQDFLRRNVCNREPRLLAVKKYFYSMAQGDWKKTGQGLVFDKSGKLNEGQQRCWASYFGKVSFETYIVSDVPVEPDMFAYYDDVKPRTAADALHTSGSNGLASHLSVAVQLHYRYANEAIGILKQPKIHKPNHREILAYSRQHPSLNETAHLIFAMHLKALSLIRNKGVGIFFCDRVIELYGYDALQKFMVPLGSGANLEEDSPILGLRNRLLSEEKISKERCLALVIKAFNYHRRGLRLPKTGLFVRDNEKFPLLEPDSENQGD